MAPRLARIRQLTESHLRSHRLEGNSLSLTYDGAAAEEVEHIVELERDCCAFLDFHVHRVGDEVELVVIGPEQAGSDAHWLFAQFLPEVPADARTQVCNCARR
jgi:hypothetical protein